MYFYNSLQIRYNRSLNICYNISVSLLVRSIVSSHYNVETKLRVRYFVLHDQVVTYKMSRGLVY